MYLVFQLDRCIENNEIVECVRFLRKTKIIPTYIFKSVALNRNHTNSHVEVKKFHYSMVRLQIMAIWILDHGTNVYLTEINGLKIQKIPTKYETNCSRTEFKHLMIHMSQGIPLLNTQC